MRLVSVTVSCTKQVPQPDAIYRRSISGTLSPKSHTYMGLLFNIVLYYDIFSIYLLIGAQNIPISWISLKFGIPGRSRTAVFGELFVNASSHLRYTLKL